MLRHGFLFTVIPLFDIMQVLKNTEVSIMSKSKVSQFTVHDIVGVDHSVSLAKIGELNSTQLLDATANFTDCDPIGWESSLSETDLNLAKQFAFDMEACTLDEDFVLFGFTKGEQKKAQLQALFNLYPDVANYQFGTLACDSYFAHVHNDAGTVYSAGQIMFVVENEAEHLLYSKDSTGKEHTFVPKKGDVVFLDVWCDHAVIPNQSKGIDYMRSNGMKLVCFAID